MVERIEDLNLPSAVVLRLIKEALPPAVSVTGEARSAIARAASVFVIYLTASSTAVSRKKNHKVISAQHILEALEQLEFESFVAPLTDDLENYRKVIKEKKGSKATAAGGSKKEDSMEVDGEPTEADGETPNESVED